MKITRSEQADINEILGEDLASFFDNNFTIDIIISYRNDLLMPLSHHIRNVFFNHQTLDEIVIESILSVALFNCDNKYCYIYHASELLRLGFTEKEIINLTELLVIPERYVSESKFSDLLRITNFLFRSSALASMTDVIIQLDLNKEVRTHFVHIIALANSLRSLLMCLGDEINLNNEDYYKKKNQSEFKDHIKNLISYSKYKSVKGEEKPMVTICSYCKDVRIKEQEWIPVEKALKIMDPDTEFSHGICTRDFNRIMKELADQ